MNIRNILTKASSLLGNKLNLDLHFFTVSSFYSFTQQLVGIISGLLVMYLFGHFVSKTTFGNYNLVLSILSMLVFTSLPGIDKALTRSVGKGFNRSLIIGTWLKFKFSFLGTPIILAIASYYAFQGNTVLVTPLIISAIFFPFLNSYTGFHAFLVGKKLFSKLAIISSFSSLFYLLSLGINILFFKSLNHLIVGYMVGLIVPSLIGNFISKRYINKKSKVDRSLIKYGYFLTGLTILPWISGHAGSILLANFLGPEALALFAAASYFFTAFQKNFEVFYKPVRSKLASQSRKEHFAAIKNHSFKLLLLGLSLSFGFWILVPLLIKIFFPTYQESIELGRLLSLAFIPLPFSWVLHDILIYQKVKNIQLIISTVPQLVKLLLYTIMIPLFSINGLIYVILIERYAELVIPLTYLLKLSHKKQ